MDILIAFVLLLGLLFSVVMWQSRNETPRPPFKVYIQRFSKLIVILLSIFKDIGVCISTQIKAIDWDLTKPIKAKPQSPQVEPTATNKDKPAPKPTQSGGNKYQYASWQ